MDAPPIDEERKPSRWKIITTLGYTVAALTFGFVVTGLENNERDIKQLERDLADLDSRFRDELLDLVEQSRVVDGLRVQIEELRRDVERILAP